jgi:hypothetical protein
MARARTRTRRWRIPIALGVAVGLCAGVAPAAGNLIDRSDATGRLVLLGPDADSTADPVIQPPDAGVGVGDQSLRKGDQIFGGGNADVLVGRLGPDVLVGNDGDDVIVGGLERGSDAGAFPNFDVAFGGLGDDVFIWAPGDGSDAFDGGEPPRFTTETVTRIERRNGKRVRVTRTRKVRSPADDDILIIGTASVLAGDNSQPELTPTSFGRLPKVDVSGRNPALTVGTAAPQGVIKGFCQVVPAPPGLGYKFLVRFFGRATRTLQVTIRVKGVERVLCRTDGADAITETRLGPKGAGPAAVGSADFRPPAGSKLAQLVS